MKRDAASIDKEKEVENDNDGDSDDYLSMDLNALEEKQTSKKTSQRNSMSYAEKRRRTVREQDRKGKQASIREREREQRETGLTAAIDASNKGFQLLKKLGYVEGTALDREGLGADQVRREQIAQALQEKNSEEKMTEEQFLTHQRLTFERRRIEADIRQARRLCIQLDEAKNITEHVLWTRIPSTNSSVPTTRLEALVDAETKEPTSPDNEAIDLETVTTAEQNEKDELERERDEFDALPIMEQLDQVTVYLRQTHLFCIWCGVAYTNDTELATQCPGNTFELHE
ncbi:hypothetical protein BDF19DRAFT_424658 [Syncephalis fuscata]|nr:hypothetical protein BDF19DRAFT_424658 [Syncephalis fuscata]